MNKNKIILSVIGLIVLGASSPSFGMDIWDAIMESNVDRVKELIKQDSNIVNAVLSGSNATPLHHATYWQSCPEIVELLLKNKANPNAANKNNATPLYYAVEKGIPVIVELLLKYKANPNAADKNNDTPLCKALGLGYFGNPEIVELLLKYKADPNMAGRWNETPIDLVLQNFHITPLAKSLKTLSLLLKNNANIDENAIATFKKDHPSKYIISGFTPKPKEQKRILSAEQLLPLFESKNKQLLLKEIEKQLVKEEREEREEKEKIEKEEREEAEQMEKDHASYFANKLKESYQYRIEEIVESLEKLLSVIIEKLPVSKLTTETEEEREDLNKDLKKNLMIIKLIISEIENRTKDLDFFAKTDDFSADYGKALTLLDSAKKLEKGLAALELKISSSIKPIRRTKMIETVPVYVGPKKRKLPEKEKINKPSLPLPGPERSKVSQLKEKYENMAKKLAEEKAAKEIKKKK